MSRNQRRVRHALAAPYPLTAAPDGHSPETSFGDNAMPHLRGLDNPDYKPLIEGMIANFRDASGPVTHATDVALAVWQVAIDPSAPLRITAGKDPVQWMAETR